MGAHETPDAVLTGLEADRLRARAQELAEELDSIVRVHAEGSLDARLWLWKWAGSAGVVLRELARG